MDWKQLIMERDGTTPCFVRILTFAAVVFLLVLTARMYEHGENIDLLQFASAFTMIIAGGAGSARVKLDTEGEAVPQGSDPEAALDRDWH